MIMRIHVEHDMNRMIKYSKMAHIISLLDYTDKPAC